MGSFDSTRRRLMDILKDVDEGKIQLPDFQRGWIWDDNRIKGLLASIAKSFPIGAIMLLETGNETVKFKPKPIEGVVNFINSEPEKLILDGQQRITSLYQTIITNRVVPTRNDKNYAIKRWYYIDMRKALDEACDLEESIISVNEDKKITENIGRKIILDLSQEDHEFEQLMFPICMLDEYDDWRMNCEHYWKYDPDKVQFLNSFNKSVVKNFEHYQVPVIELKKDNSKEAVCQVFEKVNTGGIVLTVFELLTASYAAEDYDLKKSWEEIRKQFKRFKVLDDVQNTDIIQTVTLLARYRKRLQHILPGILEGDAPAVSCKRKDMLNLTLDDYRDNFDNIAKGYMEAAKLLAQHCIFTARDLPYNTQLIPMSAIIAVLGDRINIAGNRKKLMRWYWCGVLGELYGSANETRYALDLPQVVEWIEGLGPEPKTIYDCNFNPSRLYTLRTRNSAAYKGIYALLLNEGLRDWLSNSKIDFQTYYSESIDVHHIFPVAWCEKNNIPKEQYNSIINKTPLSGGTNRFVQGDAPSIYLNRIIKKIGVSVEEFEEILRSHQLHPQLLRNDDFIAFINDRKEKILRIIETISEKAISRDVLNPEEGDYIEEPIDDNADSLPLQNAIM